jgi:transcriptional regulator with XRE-family HTH domain
MWEIKMQNTPDSIQEVLQSLRRFVNESSLSEFAIAGRLKIMMPTLTGWLAGRRVPNIESTQKIRHFLQRDAGKTEFDYRSSFQPSRFEGLRRCPFCRGRIIKLLRPGRRKQCAAICERCKAQGPPAASEAKSRERWNRRGL